MNSEEAVKEVDSEEMEALVEEGALLVDCREDEELDGGTIDGYTHWPLSRLDDFKSEVPDDKPIVIYCRSGRRSMKACQMVSNWTTQQTYSLAGGYLGYAGE